MTEDEFREKMLENGWDNDEIDKEIIMHHMRQLYGIEDKLCASPRIVVESFPCFELVKKQVRDIRKIAKEHSDMFGYDVIEVCPKVKKLLSDNTISDEQNNLDQLEESLQKSIRDKFDYLPRKYRYTADSKNQHIMNETEFRERMKEYGWYNLFIEDLIKLHDIQEAKHNVEIPFNYYLFERS